MAQTIENLPVMQETQVQSLIQEEPLEKGMAPYSSILAWRIPWTEEPGGLQPLGSQRVGHDITLLHSAGHSSGFSSILDKRGHFLTLPACL